MNKTYFSFSALLLSACGGSNSTTNKISTTNETGFASNYVAPPSNFNSPNKIDPSFKVLEPAHTAPYWVDALAMYDGMNITDQILTKSDRSIKFSYWHWRGHNNWKSFAKYFKFWR